VWTHRKGDLGRSCGLGKENSTLFPFVAVLVPPKTFIEMCLLNISAAAAAANTTMSQQQQAAAMSHDDCEFSELRNEMQSLRHRLSAIFGSLYVSESAATLPSSSSSSGTAAPVMCRISLIVENLHVAAINYLQAGSLVPSQLSQFQEVEYSSV
jgi:hypothetical protein